MANAFSSLFIFSFSVRCLPPKYTATEATCQGVFQNSFPPIYPQVFHRAARDRSTLCLRENFFENLQEFRLFSGFSRFLYTREIAWKRGRSIPSSSILRARAGSIKLCRAGARRRSAPTGLEQFPRVLKNSTFIPFLCRSLTSILMERKRTKRTERKGD